jgi:hypothetical protein
MPSANLDLVPVIYAASITRGKALRCLRATQIDAGYSPGSFFL